jgi:hypothetical protein
MHSGFNTELMNVKAGTTCNYHFALNCKSIIKIQVLYNLGDDIFYLVGKFVQIKIQKDNEKNKVKYFTF